MSKFCFYSAKGYIFPRDKEGNVVKGRAVETVMSRGCVRHDDEMYGAILRQNPGLLRCDKVDFETWGI